MHRRRFLALLPLSAAVATLPLQALLAETPEEKGLAIVKEGERRNKGWRDSVARARMVLRDRGGTTANRELSIRTLERSERDGDKSIVVFQHPPDIKGTALLTHAHDASDDDQWLFLPDLKRVKRISSSNKSGSFVGSEFSYEDMAGFQIDKYTYRHLRDEKLGVNDCFVVERKPKDRQSGYSRMIAWIDKAEYRTFKVEYFDRKNEKLKTLTAADFRRYQDKFWRSHKLEMINHQNGKATDLVWESYEFGVGLKDDDFTRTSLERAK
ncbi:MAG: outer membrane lipoprotein-sorting protein [Alphaproteobacteria bacterium]